MISKVFLGIVLMLFSMLLTFGAPNWIVLPFMAMAGIMPFSSLFRSDRNHPPSSRINANNDQHILKALPEVPDMTIPQRLWQFHGFVPLLVHAIAVVPLMMMGSFLVIISYLGDVIILLDSDDAMTELAKRQVIHVNWILLVTSMPEILAVASGVLAFCWRVPDRTCPTINIQVDTEDASERKPEPERFKVTVLSPTPSQSTWWISLLAAYLFLMIAYVLTFASHFLKVIVVAIHTDVAMFTTVRGDYELDQLKEQYFAYRQLDMVDSWYPFMLIVVMLFLRLFTYLSMAASRIGGNWKAIPTLIWLELQTPCNVYSGILKAMQKELCELEKRNLWLQSSQMALEQLTVFHNDEQRLLISERLALEKKAAKLQTTLDALKETHRGSERKKRTLVHPFNVLLRTRLATDQTDSLLQGSLKSLMEEEARLQRSLEALQGKHLVLTKERAQLQCSLKALMEKKVRLQRSIAALVEEEARLQRFLETLQREHLELMEERTRLQRYLEHNSW